MPVLTLAPGRVLNFRHGHSEHSSYRLSNSFWRGFLGATVLVLAIFLVSRLLAGSSTTK